MSENIKGGKKAKAEKTAMAEYERLADAAKSQASGIHDKLYGLQLKGQMLSGQESRTEKKEARIAKELWDKEKLNRQENLKRELQKAESTVKIYLSKAKGKKNVIPSPAEQGAYIKWYHPESIPPDQANYMFGEKDPAYQAALERYERSKMSPIDVIKEMQQMADESGRLVAELDNKIDKEYKAPVLDQNGKPTGDKDIDWEKLNKLEKDNPKLYLAIKARIAEQTKEAEEQTEQWLNHYQIKLPETK